MAQDRSAVGRGRPPARLPDRAQFCQRALVRWEVGMPRGSRDRCGHRQRLGQCLVDELVALGEAEQRLHLLSGRAGIEIEAQADGPQAQGGVLAHRECPTESRSPWAWTVPRGDPNLQRGGHGLQRDTRARHQACISMSPEQASEPSPPVAGCRPAMASALPVATECVAVAPLDMISHVSVQSTAVRFGQRTRAGGAMRNLGQ